MKNIKVKIEKGFNLAELLIVISALGIIAAIVIPASINNSRKAQQRVQLLKAMENYDSALRIFQVDKKAKSIKTINRNIGNNCENIKKYFNVIEDEGCVFKTTDNVWYQISKKDISKVAVAFEKENLDKAQAPDNNKAFLFVAEISEGKLQINNLSYNKGDAIYGLSVSKLYDFVKKNK